MALITIYEPICKDKHGYFLVNGAADIDKEEAIKKAMRHNSFKHDAEIVRVDELRIDENDYNRTDLP